jgi:hypothetical protein
MELGWILVGFYAVLVVAALVKALPAFIQQARLLAVHVSQGAWKMCMSFIYASAKTVLRYAWINIFAIAAVVVGIGVVASAESVSQIRALFHDLSDGMTPLLLTVAVWGTCIWYSMRILSNVRFPVDYELRRPDLSVVKWLSKEMPHLCAFFAVTAMAFLASVFVGRQPTGNWIVVFAVGTVPMVWGICRIADGVAGRWFSIPDRPVYPIASLIASLGGALLAWMAWEGFEDSLLDKGLPGWSLPAWSLISLAITAMATVIGFIWHQRPVGEKAMWAAFAVWLASVWVLLHTELEDDGFWLPFLVLGFAAFGLWATSRLRHSMWTSQISHEQIRYPAPRLSRANHLAAGVALGFLGLLVISFSIAPVDVGVFLGTLPIIYVALGAWCFFGAYLWVYLPTANGWPSLALVPLLWAIFGAPVNHELAETRFVTSDGRPSLEEHFSKWLTTVPRFKDGDDNDSPIYLVAAAGGGVRAAAWTASVLAAADDQTCGEFGRHVYAYSAVSGGALGVAAYLAQRQEWSGKHSLERCQPGRVAEISRFVRGNFLAPLAGSMLFAEPVQRFMPITYLKENRGSTLGRTWSKAWDENFPAGGTGRFDMPFLEVFPAISENQVGPAVFLNATSVNSGKRVVTANVRARLPNVFDLFRVGEHLRTAGLSLREAVLNSARFSYVSPAASVMRCDPKRLQQDGTCPPGHEALWDQIVDGGYYENFGIATLLDVARVLDERFQHRYRRRISIIVIHSTADWDGICRSGRSPLEPERQQARGRIPLPQSLAPILTLISVQDARSLIEIERLRERFGCANERIVEWNLFGAGGRSSTSFLGWQLPAEFAKFISHRTREHLRAFRFTHAACVDDKHPRRLARLGDPADSNVPCFRP